MACHPGTFAVTVAVAGHVRLGAPMVARVVPVTVPVVVLVRVQAVALAPVPAPAWVVVVVLVPHRALADVVTGALALVLVPVRAVLPVPVRCKESDHGCIT